MVPLSEEVGPMKLSSIMVYIIIDPSMPGWRIAYVAGIIQFCETKHDN